jgi:small subunit ribosomal protein S20
MANHPSAEKRNRQRLKRTEANKGVKGAVRTAVKKARQAIAHGDPKAASERVAEASRALARAAAKRIVHKGTAARTTSRIESQLDALRKG